MRGRSEALICVSAIVAMLFAGAPASADGRPSEAAEAVLRHGAALALAQA